MTPFTVEELEILEAMANCALNRIAFDLPVSNKAIEILLDKIRRL